MAESGLQLVVGLDLGTTSFKAVACNVNGDELAIGRVPTPWIRDDAGTTMTADAVINAVEQILQKCLSQLPNSRVISIGVTGMAESGFLVDGNDRELGPAYAWLDARGTAEASELTGAWGSKQFAAITGLPISVRCSAVKLRWMNRGRGHKEGLRWESLPEWTARRLGGRPQAELSLAGRTGLFDLGWQNWDEDLIAWAGLDSNTMPPVAAAGTSWGSVGTDHAYAPGATITVAGMDHVCAMIGAGATRDLDVFDSLGTGEAVIRSIHPLNRNEVVKAVEAGLTVGSHILPGFFHLMAGLGTGARLSRVLDALGISSTTDRLILEKEASHADQNIPEARWAIDIVQDGAASLGSPERVADPAAVWRAATDAAGQRFSDAIDRLEQFGGPHGRLIAVGGWFQSEPFVQSRRVAVGRPLALPVVVEATGRGAALLAGVAAGIFDTVLAVPLPKYREF